MVSPGDDDMEQGTMAPEGGSEIGVDEQDDLAAEWESMVGPDDDGSSDDYIKIYYDDGTKNKNMWSGYLRFTNRPGESDPTEDVWVGFP